MKTCGIIAMAIMSAMLFEPKAQAASCQANKSPSNKSCCDKDTDSTQYVYSIDQGGQTGANVTCLADCKYDETKCTFTTPSSNGCTPNGTYDTVYKRTNPGSQTTCTKAGGGGSVYYYTYSTGPAPVLQGETQKFIIDDSNCGS
jgi:hypothetical protein